MHQENANLDPKIFVEDSKGQQGHLHEIGDLEKYFRISPQSTKSAGCSSVQERKWETDIVLEEDIIIPARTEALVNAKLRTKIEGELVVCIPEDMGNGYVHAANCLMVNSTKAWIRVLNVSQKAVELMKEQKLAKEVSCGTWEEIIVTTNRMIGNIELDDEEWGKRGFSLEHLDEDSREKLMALIRGYYDLFLEDDVILSVPLKLNIA
ncbi:hypothetical protein JTB14_027515 [Gonioctena quinquepunctata]|nr:hypothetical protein JTB14_027515 [Gonioctena quinquepunctata]